LNYPWLFKLIDDSTYAGYVGCEYRPRVGTKAGLGWAKACGVTLG
jgi:2-dehydrotetronate isomerase